MLDAFPHSCRRGGAHVIAEMEEPGGLMPLKKLSAGRGLFRMMGGSAMGEIKVL